MNNAQKTQAYFAAGASFERQAAFTNDWRKAFQDFEWTL